MKKDVPFHLAIQLTLSNKSILFGKPIYIENKEGTNQIMWSKEEVIISLTCDNLPKWKLAKFVRLNKPYTRYKREEFAEIVSKESKTNLELLNLLQHKREQRISKDELNKLYLKEQNILPCVSLDPDNPVDWVKEFEEYKNNTKLRSKIFNGSWNF
ncbi:MAG: hypothetical protein Q8934_09020 [Bacillota bacterium]|nr:hypothetical protein [Bacillota bacterium]